jgi:hypothetical protein
LLLLNPQSQRWHVMMLKMPHPGASLPRLRSKTHCHPSKHESDGFSNPQLPHLGNGHSDSPPSTSPSSWALGSAGDQGEGAAIVQASNGAGTGMRTKHTPSNCHPLLLPLLLTRFLGSESPFPVVAAGRQGGLSCRSPGRVSIYLWESG